MKEGEETAEKDEGGGRDSREGRRRGKRQQRRMKEGEETAEKDEGGGRDSREG